MSNIEIYNIEKKNFSELQSNLDKLLLTFKKTKFKLNEDNLNSILLINKLIDELNFNLSDLNNSIIKKIPLSQRSENIKLRLKEYDEHNKVIKKFLPFMLADQINNI